MLSTQSVASQLSIRPATEEHVMFLVSLRNRLATEFLSGELATVEETERILPEMYVAEIDGVPVGAFSIYNRGPRDSNSIEFGRFMVEPSCQGRGYGRAMLECAIQEARGIGLTSLVLTVQQDNERAQALYREAGFSTSHIVMERPLYD